MCIAVKEQARKKLCGIGPIVTVYPNLVLVVPEHEASHLDPATFKPVAVLSMWNYPRPALRGSGSVYCSMASAIHRLVTFIPDEGPT